MKQIAHSIDLNLSEELRDRKFRRKFFMAESSARIAEQLIALRKRRGLNQKQVAELADTKQPAISRAEQADYQNWSFSTLRSIAEALDARIRVLIQPYEDVIGEYKTNKATRETSSSGSIQVKTDFSNPRPAAPSPFLERANVEIGPAN